MTAVDTFLASGGGTKLEPKRDRYGRYLLPDPASGKETSYQRATTLAKMLGDTWAIDHWNRRMVAKGLTVRPDLHAQVAAATLDEKQLLNELCEQAAEAAGSSEGRNKGSALHRFAERTDAGETGLIIPAPFDSDIAAYTRSLADAGITPVPGMAERIVVCPELGVAGTFDRIVNQGDWPFARIGDLKTAQTIWDWLEIAVQLAIYSRGAAIYDLRTQAYIEMPVVDQDLAVVFHVPAGSGTATLYEVDIATGWEAAKYAAGVREWRRRRGIASVLALTTTVSSGPVVNGGATVGPVAGPRLLDGLVGANLERKVRAMNDEQLLALSIQIVERKLPKLSEATSEHSHAWVQAVKAVVGDKLGAHLAKPDVRAMLTARATALQNIAGGVDRLIAELAAASLPRLGECPDELLDEWATALNAAEAHVDAPFPLAELDPFAGLPAANGHHATVSPVAGDEVAVVNEEHARHGVPTATTATLIDRYQTLPEDLQAQIEAARIGTCVEGVSLWAGGTSEQIELAERLVTDAEQRLLDRGNRIARLIDGLDADMIESLRIDSAADEHTWPEFTADDVDRLDALCTAIDACTVAFTYQGETPVLVPTDTALAAISDAHGGKGAAVKAAQALAKQHGRPSPRTATAAAADPLLVALATHKSA